MTVICSTWRFGAVAVQHGAAQLEQGNSALDAVEHGVRAVELDTREQYFVGYGGLPNADGVMELDAAIVDGDSTRYGAVMALQGIRTPISVARKVMEVSPHNILVGQGAQRFAVEHHFQLEDVLTEESRSAYRAWLDDQKLKHDVSTKQGAHASSRFASQAEPRGEGEHDTVGVIAMDKDGHIAAGVSTSGWAFCYPGRVGDSPLIGSGLYACKHGAAVATGDGEEIMRSCLSFLTVQFIRSGHDPTLACQLAISQLLETIGQKSIPVVGIVAINAHGQVGAGTTICESRPHAGLGSFPYVVWRPSDGITRHSVSFSN